MPTAEGWLYLAVVLDLFTRKVVGWAMREHSRGTDHGRAEHGYPTARPVPGSTHHSDRGSQYAAGDYRRILQAAASPINEPQGQLLGQRPDGKLLRHPEDRARQRDGPFPTRAARPLRFIEGFYNRQRLHSAIGYVTPEQADREIRITRCPLFRGKVIPALRTPDGIRAMEKDFRPASAASVGRYLASKFGDHLEEVWAAMEQLAASLSPEELNRRGFTLYEAFRPAIPAGARGWGAAGERDLERITGLAQGEP